MRIVSTEGSRTAAQLGAAGGVVGLYGLTNGLHLGLAVSGMLARGFEYQRAVLAREDGSRPSGTLRQSTWTASAAAVAAYRVESGSIWAVVLRADGGAAYHRYVDQSFAPDATTLVFQYAPADEFRPMVRAVVQVELRFAEAFLASVGLSGRRSFGALSGYELSVPVSLGAVMW